MASARENDPLLKKTVDEDIEESTPLVVNSASTASLYQNFVTMCIAFSFNHGCVVSCLAYATTELGDDLGGYGSGALYICYALTAFFLSKPVVSMVGPKNGLLLGVGGYCVYVAGFLASVIFSSIAWPVFIISCSIGGVAGGLLWTSQGRYFARNAKLYSEATSIPAEKVNATFAGVFATSYLGLEMVTKVLATLIWLGAPDSAPYIVFSVYAVIAFVSCIVVATISDLDESGTYDFACETVTNNSIAAGRLVVEDPRLALVIPFQIAFGFCSSFVPYYVFGTIIGDSSSLGSTYVGLLSAVIVLTGAVTAIPAAWAANEWGKPIVMTIGGLCLSFAGMALFFAGNSELGTWAFIVPYLVIYGMGRGTWENTNKAVIADLFVEMPDLSTSAFAAISFSNGLAAAIGYFTFSYMSRLQMAGLVMGTALAAIASYLLATHVDSVTRKAIIERRGKYDT